MWDVVVVFECAMQCMLLWSRSGLSGLCCLCERRVLAMNYSAWLSRALLIGTHILPPVCHHRGLLYVCW